MPLPSIFVRKSANFEYCTYGKLALVMPLQQQYDSILAALS